MNATSEALGLTLYLYILHMLKKIKEKIKGFRKGGCIISKAKEKCIISMIRGHLKMTHHLSPVLSDDHI